MHKKRLTVILDKHQKWLFEQEGGKRANLKGVDLTKNDLRGADLRYSILRDALIFAGKCKGADLRGADLRGVDRKTVEAIKADLRGAIVDPVEPGYWAWLRSSLAEKSVMIQAFFRGGVINLGLTRSNDPASSGCGIRAANSPDELD